MPLNGGDVFAGYTILRPLGAGGMGEVYLAQHPRLPRRDAIKILPAHLTQDSEFRQRFDREANLAARLWHPHIVGIHDRGEFEGQLWISMDYVQGIDAAQLLKTRYPSGMPPAEVFEIVGAVADALDYAHSQGLLHRDVKPANILLGEATTRGRRILLADFGIARQLGDVSGLTATNMTVGTAAYAAPEQLMGSDIDGRADEYALGCTAFHLLTGSHPFDHSNPVVVITQHLNAPPPRIGTLRPELAELDAVAAKALAKKPDDRYPSCSDFAAALGGPQYLASASQPNTVAAAAVVTEVHTTPVAAPPPAESIPPPTARRGLLRPATLILAIVAVVLLAVTVIEGAHLLRGDSNNAGHEATSTPATGGTTALEPGIRLAKYITDPWGALTPSGRAAVQGAIDKLYADRKIHLWVSYGKNFSGVGPLRWALNTMHVNAFTPRDVLLGIDTAHRIYAFQVPPEVIKGTPIDVVHLRRKDIEPAVIRNDWSGAAVAAATGLDTPVS
jgi:Protein kinase domain